MATRKKQSRQGQMLRTTSAIAILTGVLAASSVYAQTTVAPTAAQPDRQSTTIQEVIVTATRRETSVQKTPMSITAVTGADLKARGITDVNDIAQSVPGITLLSSGPGQTQYSMRGMSSIGGASATVGFYLDDTPMTSPAAALNGFTAIDPNLYDLGRVEILRGPQGTLFGSGSMGGTIRVVTNPPKLGVYDASAEAILGGTKGGGFNHTENAMVNIPLGDTAALRIVGTQSYESGWISRIVVANGDYPTPTGGGTIRGNVAGQPVAAEYKGVNDTDLAGARASLLWEPIAGLSITPSFFYQQIKSNGVGNIDSDPGTNAHYQPFDIAEPFKDWIGIGSLNIKYQTPWFNVTSTTSDWTHHQFQQLDSSQDWQYGFGLPSFYIPQGGIGPSTSYIYVNSKQLSQEIRLSSLGGSAFNWQIGYFYSDLQSAYNAPLLAPGAVTAPIGGTVYGTSNLYSQAFPARITQQAVFGEVSYQLTSQLKATVGVRGYQYNVSDQFDLSGIAVTGSNASKDSSATANSHGLNPKFDLSYQANDNLLIYATAAKGFRVGSGNAPIPTSGPASCEASLQQLYHTSAFVPSPTQFGPDSVWSYEVGEKFSGFDHRLTVNGDVYYEDWSQIQQNIIPPCGAGFIANAGDAHIYGSELEINAVVAEGLILSGNLGYTDAKIVSSLPGSGIAPGSPVQDIPEWTSSQSLTYRHPVSDQLTFTARVENNYVGPRLGAGNGGPAYTMPAYDLTNIRAGVENEHWSAMLFVKNLFNTRPVLGSGYGSQVIPFPEYNRLTTGQPLTAGIDLNYHWR